MVNLHRLDLNLLLTLDVLLSEHNVTRAAQRLNLSSALCQRTACAAAGDFDDPLLLPGPRGMQPTARADGLREPLRQALEALQRAVSPVSEFDPAQAQVTGAWRPPITPKQPCCSRCLPVCALLLRPAVWLSLNSTPGRSSAGGGAG